MDNFDLKKYLAEGKLYKEDYKPSHRAYNVIDGKGNIVYKELPRHTAIEKASEREDYGFIATDKLAEESNIPFSQRVEPEYTLDSIAQDEFRKNYDELDPQQQKYVSSELEITKGYPFSAGIDQDGARLPEFPDPMKYMKEEKKFDQ